MNGWRGEKTRGQNEEKRNKQSFANDKNVQIQIQVNIKSVIFLKKIWHNQDIPKYYRDGEKQKT